MQGRCQGFNCQASVNVILRDKGGQRISDTKGEVRRSPTGLHPSDVKQTDVLIIGAGPAGIAAALELNKLGVKDVVIAEREPKAGGIPRLCGHTGFGLRDFHWVMSGPAYARKYREMAERAGIKISTSTTITGWEENPGKNSTLSTLAFTSPNGLGSIEAKSVLLATGVRERPRAARLVPGTRPQGVFTTGSLQRFVYEHHLPVGKRAVIVGAEIVSLSVVLTLMHAGVRVVNMTTELPRHQLYLPILLPAKILYADLLARAPMLANKRVSNIFGRQRVEGIEITDLDSGKTEGIECDTVVFTGDWIPENELARRGDVETMKPWLGPQVDSQFHTSQHGAFAAGNLLRGVERADWAALEGRSAARSIAQFLENAQWPASRVQVQVEAPLEWIVPSVITEITPDSYRIQSRGFRNRVKLGVYQGERLLHVEHFSRLVANAPMNFTGRWNQQVDLSGAPIRIVVEQE